MVQRAVLFCTYMTANENAQIIRIHCNYKTRASVHSLVEIHLVFEQMGRCSRSVFFLVREDIPPFIQEVSSVWSLQRDNPNRNHIPGSLHQLNWRSLLNKRWSIFTKKRSPLSFFLHPPPQLLKTNIYTHSEVIDPKVQVGMTEAPLWCGWIKK